MCTQSEQAIAQEAPPPPMRVLMVARARSVANDAARALRQGGLIVDVRHVSSGPHLALALDNQNWDAVIHDGRLRRPDAASTLAQLRGKGQDIPFLVLAPDVPEADGLPVAASARHYVLKPETGSLLAVLEREARSAAVRGDRRRVVEATQEAERDWQATFEAIGDAIAILGEDGTIRRANGAFHRLAAPTGLSPVGRACAEIMAALGASPDALDHFGGWRAGSLHARADMVLRPRTFEVTLDPLPAFGGRGGGSVLVLSDVSKRVAVEATLAESNRQLHAALSDLRQAQLAVVRQERLNALGQMVSGVAHDFNNVLMPIVGLPQMLLEEPSQLDDRERVTAVLRAVTSAGEDAREIVRRLREFYQPDRPIERQPIDVNLLVERALALTEPAWRVQAQASGRHIGIVREFGRPPPIWGQEANLREVLTNLILNAVDAIHGDGTIRITTAEWEDGAQIRVADTGTGMSPEIQQRLFEPFFTTKGERGSGLGLAASYGIVRRHGGTIDVESRSGAGSAFTLRLPIGAPSAPAVPVSAPADATPGAGLRILLAEDDPPVRALLQTYLETAGHRVETVVGGLDALARLQAAPFDLLMTDRAMPGMDGDALAREAKRMLPRLPVIMVSGFGDLMREQSQPPEGVDLIVGKPVSRQELLHAIGSLVPARRPHVKRSPSASAPDRATPPPTTESGD